MPRKTLVLDVGRVCVDFDPRITVRLLAPFAGRPLPVNDHPFFGPDEERFERGEIAPAEFFTRIRAAYELRTDVGMIEAAWNAMLTDEMPGMFELLAENKGRFRLVALTNTTAPHYETFMRKPIMRFFDDVVSSHVTGLQKPDPRIFRHVENLIGGRPVLFTDDRADNVCGAQDAGWPSAIFTDSASLRARIGEIS